MADPICTCVALPKRLQPCNACWIKSKAPQGASSTAYYLATVWMGTDEEVRWGVGTRRVIRIWACGPDDFKTRIREAWPSKVVTFGPVGRSKVQG